MGMAYANERIIQYMNNVKAPYNVNRLTQEVGVRALTDRTLYLERVAAILEVCLEGRGFIPGWVPRLQKDRRGLHRESVQ